LGLLRDKMPEARFGLLHFPTRRVVAKEGFGDCPAQMSALRFDGHNHDAFNTSNLCNKLQVVSRDASGTPSVIWIRNDWHPQRCLWNGRGKIRWVEVWSKKYTQSKWQVCLAEETATTSDGIHLHSPRLFSLRSVHDDLFLGTDGATLYTSTKPELWGCVRVGDAWSPVDVATLGLSVPFAIVRVAVAAVGAVGTTRKASDTSGWAAEIREEADERDASAGVAEVREEADGRAAMLTAAGAVGGALHVADEVSDVGRCFPFWPLTLRDGCFSFLRRKSW